MPVRQYLDQTVVPVILRAMTEVAKERYAHEYMNRPEDPLQFVANYILKNKGTPKKKE